MDICSEYLYHPYHRQNFTGSLYEQGSVLSPLVPTVMETLESCHMELLFADDEGLYSLRPLQGKHRKTTSADGKPSCSNVVSS